MMKRFNDLSSIVFLTKENPTVQRFKAILLALGLLIPLAGNCRAAADDWSFTISPYLWVAYIDAETTLPGTGVGAVSFDTRITGAAMAAAQVRYRAVGLFADFAWIGFNSEADLSGRAFASANIDSDVIHATTALTYRLPLEGKFQAEALAGARTWYVGLEETFQGRAAPSFSASNHKAWVDPVVGANLGYDFTPKWSAEARGIVGGFGVSAEISWEAFAGVRYRFVEWCSATVGYRYIYEKYDRDNYEFRVGVHGFLLGLGFHF